MEIKKTAAFTICANNYLPQAAVLARTFKEFHKSDFYIFLVDKPQNIDANEQFFADAIIPISRVVSDKLMLDYSNKYKIAEVCTAIKPDVFLYLNNLEYDISIYLDPDIQVFSFFKELFIGLKTNSVAVTPHICSPINHDGRPNELDLSRTGIYNLGFLAVKYNESTLNFIKWWKDRIFHWGFDNRSRGMFYDQKLVDYITCFVDDVCILRHKGYNVANWNLHERKIDLIEDEELKINGRLDIKFIHFSNLKESNFPYFASYNNQFNGDNSPEFYKLSKQYIKELKGVGLSTYQSVLPYYGLRTNESGNNRFFRGMKIFKRGLRMIIYGY